MVKCIFITYPRSGHHLAKRICIDSQGWTNQYCEYYSVPNCCRQFPCIRDEIRFQKTHDFNLDVPTNADARYVVQYRQFIPSTISAYNLRYAKDKNNESYDEWIKFSQLRKRYWIRFVKKWLVDETRPQNMIAVNYDDLISDLEKWGVSILTFAGAEFDLDRLKGSISAEPRRQRQIEEFKYFDEEYFYELERSVEEISRQAGLPLSMSKPSYSMSGYRLPRRLAHVGGAARLKREAAGRGPQGALE